MELTKQVCSLELAKKLKELGVKQESYFVWAFDKHVGPHVSVAQLTKRPSIASAFTVAELGEMLPYHLDISCPVAFLHTIKLENGNYRSCYDNEAGVVANKFRAERIQFTGTEADARAKTLIYLLENKLITL